MTRGRTVLSQILQLVPRSEFDKLVREHRGEKGIRSFPCWTHFVSLVYAQLSRQTSLRDIVLALETKKSCLYHTFGVTEIRRSTLADANERRSYLIYEALFAKLYQQCLIQAPAHRFRFRHKLYSFDASVVSLCLSVFPWATYRHAKGAIKLHALLDHEGHIPSFVRVTTGSTHEIHEGRKLRLEPDSIVTFDRGYVDQLWFAQIAAQGAYFVTRLKRGMGFRVLARRRPPPLSGVTCDQTIRLRANEPDSIRSDLRRVGYVDPGSGRRYFFLTNAFHLSAKTIAEIYRARWQVELFFKWIKQHLRIKTFLGTSSNAVMSQVYAAMITYLLLSYLKFSCRSPLTLYAIAKRIEVSLFDFVDLRSLLTKHIGSKRELTAIEPPVQLSFTWAPGPSHPDSILQRIHSASSIQETLGRQGQ
jgi:putative transposase